MSDGARVDREALREAIYDAIGRALYGPGKVQNDHDFLTDAADAVLALLPAPHPQGVPVPVDYTQIVADLLRQRDALVDEIATLHAAIPASTDESMTHAGPCGPACVATEAMWRAAPASSEVVEVDLRLHDGGCGYPDECTCAPAPTEADDE